MSASSPSTRRWWGVDGRRLPVTVSRHHMASAATFIIICIVAVAVSLPGATVLTVTSGLLFERVTGAVATEIGATLIFLVAHLGRARRRMIGWKVTELWQKRSDPIFA